MYSRPAARFRHGDPLPAGAHAPSSDLFFDTCFVAALYKIGNIVASGAEDGHPFGESFGVYLCLFFLFYQAWVGRLALSSTLCLEDNFHGLNFVLQAAAVAVATYALPKRLERLSLLSSNNALIITVCLGVNALLRVLIWLELAVVERDQANVRRFAAMSACIGSVTVLFALGGALAISLGQASIAIIASLWFLQYFAARLLWLLAASCGRLDESNTVPSDASYTILRFGQFTMLCLGEGALQIVYTFTETTSGTVALFALSYLLLAMLASLRVTLERDRPWEHVLKVDSRGPASAIWVELFGWFSAALVTVGVAMKMLMLVQRAIDMLPWLYAE
jgi:hypothetical protein